MIWRISERFNMRPPKIKNTFYNCSTWDQAMLLAYGQIRDYEEMEVASCSV